MKNFLLIACISWAFCGCVATHKKLVENSSTVQISQLADSTKVIKGPLNFTLSSDSWVDTGVLLGGRWQENNPQVVIIETRFKPYFLNTTAKELYLSIDGDVTKYISRPNKENSNISDFDIPIEIVKKIPSSKITNFKIVSVEGGEFKGMLKNGEFLSPAGRSIINLVNAL